MADMERKEVVVRQGGRRDGLSNFNIDQMVGNGNFKQGALLRNFAEERWVRFWTDCEDLGLLERSSIWKTYFVEEFMRSYLGALADHFEGPSKEEYYGAHD